MSNSDDPGYWEDKRRKAMEAANQPGATANDRQDALEIARDAERQLQRIGQQRAPILTDAPATEIEDDPEKPPLVVEGD